jgi:FkbM family methyltransferase
LIDRAADPGTEEPEQVHNDMSQVQPDPAKKHESSEGGSPVRDLDEIGAAKITQTRYGPLAYFDFDGVIGRALELYGEWAENEIAFLDQFVPSGSTVVDAGANIGTHTIAFAQVVGPEGSVVAIEASPEIGFILRHNVSLNQLSNVSVLVAAVGGTGAEVSIPKLDPGVRSNVGGLHPGSAASPIDLKTPTVAIDSLGLRNVSLLKFDVEGCEFDALKGAVATLKACKPVVFCELLDLDLGMDLIRFLDQFGYRPYFAACMAYNPENFLRNPENSFGHTHEPGLLFVPPERPIPRQTVGMYIHAVSSLSDLAKYFLEMPRYGDKTPHDRILESLWRDRDQRDQRISLLEQQIGGGDQARTMASLASRVDDLQAQLTRCEALRSAAEKLAENRRLQIEKTHELLANKRKQLDAARAIARRRA